MYHWIFLLPAGGSFFAGLSKYAVAFLYGDATSAQIAHLRLQIGLLYIFIWDVHLHKGTRR